MVSGFLLGKRGHILPIKPFRDPVRLTLSERMVSAKMYDWSFSATAEWVVGALLVVAIVATMFV